MCGGDLLGHLCDDCYGRYHDLAASDEEFIPCDACRKFAMNSCFHCNCISELGVNEDGICPSCIKMFREAGEDINTTFYLVNNPDDRDLIMQLSEKGELNMLERPMKKILFRENNSEPWREILVLSPTDKGINETLAQIRAQRWEVGGCFDPEQTIPLIPQNS